MDGVSPAKENKMVDRIPPPPPPPPPPLPPPPSLGEPTGGLRLNKRVRSFFWKTIPEEQVRGRANLWTRGPAQQRYQMDANTVEELFGQKQGRDGDTMARGGRGRSALRDAKDQVSILDTKRGMNMGIFLKQFKRSNQAIFDDIRHGNSEPYGAEPLRELMKLLPDAAEVKKIKAYSGDVSKLPLADSFVFLLIQLPSYATRIECMLAKEEIPGMCEAMHAHIGVLRSATKEVLGCQELHAVLHLVLQAGNILNAGGHGGNAAGFKLSSLLSLADTKANKPGMNLLHFVALEAQKTDEKLLDFPLKLSHVQAASRISLETLDAELQRLMCRTRTLEESVRTDRELLRQLDGFLQDTTSRLCSLRGGRQLLSKEAGELMDFFCEDDNTFRLDECFAVLHGFCCKFSHAVKENKEREAKERARRRRLQALEERKRHSWAGGEEVGGAVGWYRSSETDLLAAVFCQDEASVLLELLSPKSSGWRASRRGTGRSRHSPPRSPASPSRHMPATQYAAINVDAAPDLDGGGRKTLSENDPEHDDILTGVNDNSNIAVLLENCSLEVEGPARLCDVAAACVEEPRASDEAMAAQTAVVWCVTAVCEANRPIEKEEVSCSQSEPISRQPPPSSTLCVSPADPPQSDRRKKSASSEAVAAATSGMRSKQVRTLNNSEKQSMRRVVPLSRTGREKRGGERPSATPSSQRASAQPRDSKERRVPAARKRPEEKMCRSTLRTLGSRGGGTPSAPVAPPPTLSSGPTFTRSTASSSFRQTHAGLPRANVLKRASSASAEHPRTSSSSSLTPSMRTPSRNSTPPSVRTSPGFSTPPNIKPPSRVRKSANITKPPSIGSLSNVRTSATIGTPPGSAAPGSLAPHKRQGCNGSFSDKSNQSQNSLKVSRPSWR
ncbi:FH2 domain-containing protein 1-like isoform X2 [Vanacampus margaritifer]